MSEEIIGHYKVLQILGTGGMGTVYLAEDMTLGRQVAIKALRPCSEDLHLERDRFLHEARVISQIDHPNVVTLHEVIHRERSCYLVMQYVPGDTLRDAMNHRSLSYEESIRFATEIAEGLRAAHGAGIVHRDIKPDNVKLTETGTCKILDFGVSHLVDKTSLTPTGFLVGTLPYMPPEQIEGKPIDQRADIYSLGALLFEMLSGRAAFPQSEKAALLKAVLQESPPTLGSLCPDLPPGTTRVVERALSKKPEHRYQSIDEMLHDLRVLEAEARGAARSPTQRLLAPRRRQLVPALVGALAVVIAMGVGSHLAQRSRAGAQAHSRILIAPFEGPAGNAEVAWLSRGIMDLLIEGLAPLSRHDVIARQTALAALEASGWTAEAPRGYLEGARRLEAAYLLTGSYRPEGDGLRLAAELQSVRDGTVLAGQTLTIEDPAADLLPALRELATSLARGLPRPAGRVSDAPRSQPSTTSLPALREFQMGLERSELGDYAEACASMRAAVEIDPEFAEAHLYLSRFSGDLEERTRHLHLAMKYRHRAPEPHERLIEAAYLESQGQIADALDRYESVLAEFPENRDARLSAAMLYFQTRRFHEAVAEFTLIRAGDPFDYSYFPMFWMAYVEIGRPDKALALVEDWRATFPDAPAPLAQVIQARHLLGDLEGALARCDTLATLAPGMDLMPRCFILADLRRMHEAEAALDALASGQTARDRAGRLRTWRADLDLRRERFEAGLAEAREAVALQPDGYTLWIAGRLAAAAGDLEEARRHEESLAALIPGESDAPVPPEAYSDRRFLEHLRGSIAMAEEDPAVARSHFEAAVRVAGRIDEPLYRTALAASCFALGRLDEAEASLDRVLEIHPTCGDALLLLARVRLAQERDADARDLCRRLEALWKNGDPDDCRIRELQRIRKAARVVELGLAPHGVDPGVSFSPEGG